MAYLCQWWLIVFAAVYRQTRTRSAYRIRGTEESLLRPLCVCVCACVCVWESVCMCLCVCMCMCRCVCMCVWECVCVYVCMCMCVWVCMFVWESVCVCAGGETRRGRKWRNELKKEIKSYVKVDPKKSITNTNTDYQHSTVCTWSSCHGNIT